MPPARSSSARSRSRSGRATKSSTAAGRPATAHSDTREAAGGTEGLRALVEQLVSRVLTPLGIVLLSRERIQETLDEAAERGRITRSDANDVVSELWQRGCQQTEDLLGDLERLLDRGRAQIDAATKRARRSEPVDRLVRNADRARRSVGVGPSFPVLGYDELTARQVEQRLGGLTRAELRHVREYERQHANRKSVLDAIERALA